MTTPQRELIRSEEAKRLRRWNAADRWRIMQETITWAESQTGVRRNNAQACLAKEQRILGTLRQLSSSGSKPG